MQGNILGLKNVFGKFNNNKDEAIDWLDLADVTVS